MSTADPHGEDALSRPPRRRAFWETEDRGAGSDAQDHEAVTAGPEPSFKALEELKAHLNRLGSTGAHGEAPRQDVRQMQQRIASLTANANTDFDSPNVPDDDPYGSGHEPWDRLEERLADLAAHLERIKRRERAKRSRQQNEPILVRLDETSMAWIDQRFAGLRTRLEEALEFRNAPPIADRVSTRIAALERRMDTVIELQERSGKELLGAVDSRLAAFSKAPSADLAPAERGAINAKIAHLAETLGRSMHAMRAMKDDARRLAAEAGEKITEKTAELTARRVQESLREWVAEKQLSAMESNVAQCLSETKALVKRQERLEHALQQEFGGLRTRIEGLAAGLRTGKGAPVPQAGKPGRTGSEREGAPAQEWLAGDDLLDATRDAIESVTKGEDWKRDRLLQGEPEQSRFRNFAIRTEGIERNTSWVGLIAVVLILLIASLAMLYAHFMGKQLPRGLSPSPATAPASTIFKKSPYPADVFLPGTLIAGSVPEGI